MCLEGQGEGSELINHQQWTELGPRANPRPRRRLARLEGRGGGPLGSRPGVSLVEAGSAYGNQGRRSWLVGGVGGHMIVLGQKLSVIGVKYLPKIACWVPMVGRLA